MDSNFFCLHESHGEPEKRILQVGQIINLPPVNGSSLELGLFMIAAVLVNNVPSRRAKRSIKNVESGAIMLRDVSCISIT
jgi:hypothetical protein